MRRTAKTAKIAVLLITWRRASLRWSCDAAPAQHFVRHDARRVPGARGRDGAGAAGTRTKVPGANPAAFRNRVLWPSLVQSAAAGVMRRTRRRRLIPDRARRVPGAA